jgi:type I restriction enzyme S subunit
LTGRGASLLDEYRTRRIADVVTGKLDVREAAAGLPEVDSLAAEDEPDDGSNPEGGLRSDQFGVAGQEADV